MLCLPEGLDLPTRLVSKRNKDGTDGIWYQEHGFVSYVLFGAPGTSVVLCVFLWIHIIFGQ